MNNFTLIIPTHNRHHCLKRSMEYFKDLNATVIYCDSSVNTYAFEIPHNVKYLHYPGLKFESKIMSALDIVKTEFVALCADDDFIIIDSLYIGCKILESNQDFKTIVCKYISFNADFNGEYYPLYKNIP